MLYDGGCPLCEREVNFLRSRDEGKGAIDFVDIDGPDFGPEWNMGITFPRAMASIHAIRADGSILSGVAVFRELYEAVGLGWVYAVTKNETVGALAEKVYDFWAERRTNVTGRGDLAGVLAARAAAERENADGASCRAEAE
eukprot:PRCOL_00006774-RA